MDGTIITTKSGRVFPKDGDDWKFISADTRTKLKTYFLDNPDTKFLIITNQAGIGKGKTDIKSFQRKIEAITSAIGIPVLVFVATGKNEFRKPLTAIYDLYIKDWNEGLQVNLEESFFCGDAAGRKKDHSKVDRLFALNLGIPFKLPEQFFRSSKKNEAMSLPDFLPQKLIDPKNIAENEHIKFSREQEVNFY